MNNNSNHKQRKKRFVFNIRKLDVAYYIAEKIYRVSEGSQVLCISHLPQVAAMADIHLFISKEITEGRTKTNVKPLEKEERVIEIGRMISGKELTALTEEHVKEMLNQADQIKYNIKTN